MSRTTHPEDWQGVPPTVLRIRQMPRTHRRAGRVLRAWGRALFLPVAGMIAAAPLISLAAMVVWHVISPPMSFSVPLNARASELTLPTRLSRSHPAIISQVVSLEEVETINPPVNLDPVYTLPVPLAGAPARPGR
ncbi:hypothetical protein Pan216_40710 [Planctomycetes bacterium Pan216]|uniref:Uncharacterized protein n=1 Tax=Kolteria novifilia TaxID=2527975 RepID=A0A518B893_9BACT|nr:hypothetical protein Pan216_40710 [Planctomycetes bacterium Pan216]